jgi:hypothetical protein
MKLKLLGLLATMSVAAIPLAASAATESAGAETQSTRTTTQRAVSADDRCGPGMRWVEAGYAKRGKWRPAHCGPRTMDY